MHGARPAYQARDDSLHALPEDRSGAALMAAEFVFLTSYYTGKPVAVSRTRVVLVEDHYAGARLRIDDGTDSGDHMSVGETPAVVVARLNGEDQTDGR